MEGATAAHRPLEMETASRRHSAATGVWGSIGSAEIFAEGAAHATTKFYAAIIAGADAPCALLLHSEIDAAGHRHALEAPLLLSSDVIIADVELDQRPIVGVGCQSISGGGIHERTCTWGGRQQP
jgi:hypothetical protein